MKRIIIYAAMCCLVVIFCNGCENKKGTSKNPKVEFERKYAVWRDYISSHPEFKVMSIATTQYTCPQFTEIVKLGLPALPYIVRKIEEVNDQYLWMAIDKITKVKIYAKYDEVKKETVYPDFPDVKENVYIYWWREGHKSTQNLLEERYAKWKELKMQQKEKEAGAEYQRILDLGIAALPYMVEKVKKGDIELIEEMSELTNGQLKKGTNKEDVEKWWNQNKESWIIPFPKE